MDLCINNIIKNVAKNILPEYVLNKDKLKCDVKKYENVYINEINRKHECICDGIYCPHKQNIIK